MDELKSTLELGIVGFGEMGQLYGKAFMKAGWKHINICDLPQNYDSLQKKYEPLGYKVYKTGFEVARRCDFVMFSVEAAVIDQVVEQFGPAIKMNSIVCGQTSVKSPEIRAFEKYLPLDVHIITCHSLHGPFVDPKGQPMVVINHKSTLAAFEKAMMIFNALESKIVHLSFEEHDQITADTQAVTHLAFLSMGTAWKAAKTYPWENEHYVGGIENVKTLIPLRMYGSKWHVYAGIDFNRFSTFESIRFKTGRTILNIRIRIIQNDDPRARTRIQEASL